MSFPAASLLTLFQCPVVTTVSPDGKQIAFQYFRLGTSGINIGLRPIDGGPITKIAEAPFRPSPILRWTRDGSALAYIDNRGGAGQIWAQPIGGGPPRKLTDFKSDSIFWFDFSRDGKQLALARAAHRRATWCSSAISVERAASTEIEEAGRLPLW